jgi:hypothetical protein
MNGATGPNNSSRQRVLVVHIGEHGGRQYQAVRLASNHLPHSRLAGFANALEQSVQLMPIDERPDHRIRLIGVAEFELPYPLYEALQKRLQI